MARDVAGGHRAEEAIGDELAVDLVGPNVLDTDLDLFVRVGADRRRAVFWLGVPDRQAREDQRHLGLVAGGVA